MSDEITKRSTSGRMKWMVAVVVIVIALLITALMLLPKAGTAKKVSKQLSLGAKYLSELEYEQAIAAYELAIEIDPKCVDAYLELADIYSELGEYDMAEEILKKAKREVAEEDVAQIRRKQEKIEKKREETEGNPGPTNEPKPTAEPVQTPKPTATPTPEPTATPTPEPTATPTPEPERSVGSRVKITGRTVELENASVGDYVTFGTYEQDNDLENGAEAIEWLVLEKKDGKALLLSKYALDAKPYNEEYTSVTWETCTLRSWLNSDFYHTAFSEKERASIAETLVRNADNPLYGTEGGNDTRDKVFLLSIEEVTTYFDPDPNASDPARRAKVTEYAKAQGGLYSQRDEYYGTEYYGNGWWWLRSPGSDSSIASDVDSNGYVIRDSSVVDGRNDVVRPALWIEHSDTIDTPEPTATPTPEPERSVGSRVTITGRTVELENASVGDYVTFGTYEQDNNLENGAEAIEWLVLEKKDGKALLLSKYALDAKPYNEEYTSVTWETCTLRSWLNNGFYQTAFSQKERSSIAETLIRNADSPLYGRTEGGNDTRDKVFLLSIEEVTTYFDIDSTAWDPARRAKVTEYAKAQGGWWYYISDKYYGNGWWWLRSPGRYSNYAAGVHDDGSIDLYGDNADSLDKAVRPALWIELSDTIATPEPTVTPKPTATPAPTKSAALDPVQAISKASVGDYVTFGTYEQDNDRGNGAEDIEWLVLEKKDGKALLLSKYALDTKPYNEDNTEVTWETCTLRSWLNKEFYTTAFKEKERSSIAETLVRNADNPEYGTEGGNDTRDKVFLLSIEEATTYFDANPDAEDLARGANVTEYAKAQGAWGYSEAELGWRGTTEYDGNGKWWLRSPGVNSFAVATVEYYDIVHGFGDAVYFSDNVVRPVLWVAY